jgi:hypothetical protein
VSVPSPQPRATYFAAPLKDGKYHAADDLYRALCGVNIKGQFSPYRVDAHRGAFDRGELTIDCRRCAAILADREAVSS